MKVLSCLLSLTVVVSSGLWGAEIVAAQNPSTTDKAIGIEGRAIAKTQQGGQRWALIVGINDYHNVPRLKSARQDARAMAKVLVGAGFPQDNIMLMTDGVGQGPLYPTRSNLRARIDQAAHMAGAKDALFVFFSGHGVQRNGRGFLVPIDGQGKDLGSLVPLSWVKETIESSPAQHRLLILDACHSGAKSGDMGDSPAEALLGPLDGAAFATISSCDVAQLS